MIKKQSTLNKDCFATDPINERVDSFYVFDDMYISDRYCIVGISGIKRESTKKGLFEKSDKGTATQQTKEIIKDAVIEMKEVSLTGEHDAIITEGWKILVKLGTERFDYKYIGTTLELAKKEDLYWFISKGGALIIVKNTMIIYVVSKYIRS